MVNDHWIGQILNGRYRIDQLLGQGGMSSVYKAYDPNLRRTVAIKLIHPHLSTNPDFLRRFEEEAAAVATLRDGHIVQVYDFNHDGDVYYMILEYLAGETLEDYLKRLNEKNLHVDQAEAAKILTQTCDAVNYAHKRGLIHRDIKPANIMLDEHGNAILMDFGIARIVGGQIHTAAGAVVGTALYMSPEQIQGEKVDTRTDIYSLGVTLFETLSGKPPFEADSAMTLMMMHLNDPIPDIRALRPRIVDGLIAIISRALEKNRDNRYQSAAEMAAALRAISAHLALSTAHLTDVPGSPVIQTLVTPPESRLAPEIPVAPVIPPQGVIETKVATSQNQPLKEKPTTGSKTPVVEQNALPHAALSAKSAKGRPSLALIGVIAILAVLLLAAAAGAAILLNRPGGIASVFSPPSQTPQADSGVLTPIVITQVVTSVPPTALAQTVTTPIIGSTTQPVASSGDSPPADQPYYVRIDQIIIENGRYVAEYTTFGFTEKLGDLNIHFFYDTVSPDQAGAPSKGPWVLFGGPHPFKGYTVASRPKGATQLCALVANADHTVRLNSGNCVNLP